MNINSPDAHESLSGMGQGYPEFIKGTRFLAARTQVEFAEAIGAGQQSVARWEHGGVPQRRYRLKLGEVFGLTLEENDALAQGTYVPRPELGQDLGEQSLDEQDTRTRLMGAFITRISNGPPLSEPESRILELLLQVEDSEQANPTGTVTDQVD